MCSSMDFLWLIIRLSIGWLPMMLTVVVHVTHLTLRRLTLYIYIYGAPILDVSRSHTTTQHSR